MRDVGGFFNAKSFAVIGVSQDEKNPGHIIFRNLFEGGQNVVGINPKRDKILGQRIYNDLFEVPYDIDCAIIATPAESVPIVLLDCAKKGINNVVIISAGFSEAGNSKLAKKVLLISEENNINILGPNCFGFINPRRKINTTFFKGMPERGGVAFISQSGAIGSAVLDRIKSFSGFVSIGNSLQLDFSDFIDYFSKDANTKIITVYMESLKEARGEKFIKAVKKCKKPIVILKAGKSTAGKKAAQTHTASLASEAGVYSGIFEQLGVIEASSVRELFRIAKIVEKYEKIKKRGLIVTNAGGLGVLTSDYCELYGINVVKIPRKSEGKVMKIIPHNATVNNPLDILGDADEEDYGRALGGLDNEKFFDFFMVLLTPQDSVDIDAVAKKLGKLKKPVFACFVGGESVLTAKKTLVKEKIPFFEEPEEMIKAIGKTLS